VHILVANAGSSSLNVSVVDAGSGSRLCEVRVAGIETNRSYLIVDGVKTTLESGVSHKNALVTALQQLTGSKQYAAAAIVAVGHRVVHGGEAFQQTTLVDEAVLNRLDGCSELAPLHNPPSIAAIRALKAALPNVPHFAVFDTSFHATLPRRAKTYALPAALSHRLGLRRFGFHGISHAWIAQRAADHVAAPLDSLRLVTCHLGHGASITAVEFGRSIDTSMGMTPLEGLMMGTRAGDLDPGIMLLLQKSGMSPDQIERLLNFESGLLGMTGTSDVEQIEDRAATGDDACRLALHVFTHRVRRYIGAMSAVVGGPDAIVISGGIGQNSPYIRSRVLQGLDFIGAHLDEDLNRNSALSSARPAVEISTKASRVKLLVIASEEDLAIAHDVTQHLAAALGTHSAPEHIPVAVSGRHVHLCQTTIDSLFGPGHRLTRVRELGQPDQFAAAETVTLIGPRSSIEGVRVIGPARDEDQIEISRSDEFVLGIDAPIRLSGHLDGTPGILILGPENTVTLRQGVICSHRHIHMTPADAVRLGVSQGASVTVDIHGTDRALSFGNVLVRISPNSKLEMHIDTDEANAADIGHQIDREVYALLLM
jgi:acetate kinase